MKYKIGDIIPCEKIKNLTSGSINCFYTNDYIGLVKCTFELTEDERNYY